MPKNGAKYSNEPIEFVICKLTHCELYICIPICTNINGIYIVVLHHSPRLFWNKHIMLRKNSAGIKNKVALDYLFCKRLGIIPKMIKVAPDAFIFKSSSWSIYGINLHKFIEKSKQLFEVQIYASSH